LPTSLLCVPLLVDDEVIGVIELMDKQSAHSFDASDILALGLFANQAAVAIEQSRSHRSLADLLRELLGSTHDASAGAREDLLQRVSASADKLEADASFRRALDLALIVHEVAQHGEEESAACLAILRGFADYLRALDRRDQIAEVP
jgi:GAF domain-containing protein